MLQISLQISAGVSQVTTDFFSSSSLRAAEQVRPLGKLLVHPVASTCTLVSGPRIWHAGYPVTLCHAFCKLMTVSLNSSHMVTVVHGSVR